jgi:hypothetical protein
MTNIEIVHATPQMLQAFCGSVPKTVRAFAAVKNGEVLGVSGTYIEGTVKVVFSKLTDELRKDKRAMVLGVRKVQSLYRDSKIPVRAAAENIKGSEMLLEHMDFELVGDGVYAWRG